MFIKIGLKSTIIDDVNVLEVKKMIIMGVYFDLKEIPKNDLQILIITNCNLF